MNESCVMQSTSGFDYCPPKEAFKIKRCIRGRKSALMRRNRLVGRQFGSLTVVARYAGSYWVCRCACGAERFVLGGNLTSGNTRSCGCVNRATPKPPRAKRWSMAHRLKLSAAASRRDRSKLVEAAKRRWARPGERDMAAARTREQIAKYGHPRRREL